MSKERSSVFTTDEADKTRPEPTNADIFQHLITLEDEFERHISEHNGDESGRGGEKPVRAASRRSSR